MEQSQLAEAKRKFIASAETADPLNIVRRHPLPSVGIACLLGVSLGRTGGAFSKNLWTLAETALLLSNKFFLSSLPDRDKLDERQKEE